MFLLVWTNFSDKGDHHTGLSLEQLCVMEYTMIVYLSMISPTWSILSHPRRLWITTLHEIQPLAVFEDNTHNSHAPLGLLEWWCPRPPAQLKVLFLVISFGDLGWTEICNSKDCTKTRDISEKETRMPFKRFSFWLQKYVQFFLSYKPPVVS